MRDTKPMQVEALAQQPTGKPVAWRYKNRTSRHWVLQETKPSDASPYVEHDATIEPLYAHPHAEGSPSNDYILPCDVKLAPATTITKGCTLATLMAAFRVREGDSCKTFSCGSESQQLLVKALERALAQGEDRQCFTTDLMDEIDEALAAARCSSLDTKTEDIAVAWWMAQNGYATGHGDTIADMLDELEAQAKRRSPAGNGEQALLRELYEWCRGCNDFRVDSNLARRVQSALRSQPETDAERLAVELYSAMPFSDMGGPLHWSHVASEYKDKFRKQAIDILSKFEVRRK